MRKHFLGIISLAALFVVTDALALIQTSGERGGVPSQSAGSANQPQAHGGQQFQRKAGERVFGTISSVGVDRLELKTTDGATQTVLVDDQTRYLEGGRDAQRSLGLEDLKPADRVFVQGKRNDKSEFMASVVRRITDQEIQRFSGQRAGGEITSIQANEIKVRNPWQGERTVVVNEQTAFVKDGQPIGLKDLKLGDRIFALGQESKGQFIAARVMTGQFRRGQGRSENGRPSQPDNPQ